MHPPWYGIPTRRHIITNSASDEFLALIQGWLEECRGHDICSRSDSQGQATVLPTRTVFVGESNDQIRLVENGGLEDHYTCLSHCWGGVQPLQTRIRSIGEFREGIAWESLPKTFQDAVMLTRRLGLRHIWIDSLCIIQDDQADWALESSRMAAIYSHAYLTLAATSSKDSAGGLFREREKPFGFTIQSLEQRVFAKALTHGDHIQQPLLERAWVLQERLLSPRVLHFFDKELVWECRTEAKCECEDRSPTADHHEMRGCRSTWTSIVTNYSRLGLTRDDDRLPALSGLAQDFFSRPAQLGSYLAGLWERDLVRQLSWNRRQLAKIFHPNRSVAHYRAPTWSWASTEGEIYYLYGLKFPLFLGQESEVAIHFAAKVLSASCTPSTIDPYGQVSGGYVELETGMIPALYPAIKDNLNRYCPAISLEVDCLSPLKIGVEDFDFKHEAIAHSGKAGLYCAVLELGHLGHPGHESAWFLLLAPTGNASGEWKRVGWMSRPVGSKEVKLRVMELVKSSITTLRIV